MKILIDESLDIKLKNYITEFEAFTVRDMHWKGVKNGQLLKLADENGFNIFLTADRNVSHQQNLTKYNLTVIAFKSFSNDISSHISLIPELSNLLSRIKGNLSSDKYYEI